MWDSVQTISSYLHVQHGDNTIGLGATLSPNEIVVLLYGWSVLSYGMLWTLHGLWRFRTARVLWFIETFAPLLPLDGRK